MLGRKSRLWFAAAAITVLSFATAATAGAATRERPCNGSVELCSRTLDQVVLPGTHNSMSNSEYNWGIPNQHYSIPTQLQYGVRAFLADTHYGKPNGDGTVSDVSYANRNDAGVKTYFCHSSCSFGASELTPELAKVTDFLSRHPREVLIFVIEDEVSPQDFAAAVTDSGLIDYIYTGSTDTYPTLRQLIADNQRVVMLSEDHVGSDSDYEAVPWYHRAYDGPMQETPYNFLYDESNTALTPSQGIDLLTTPATLNSTCRPNRGDTTGSLFLMNHWVNGFIDSTDAGTANFKNVVPDPAVAQFLNQPDVLVARARACEARRGKLPNIVAVDDFGEGDLIDAVRQLNGVTAKPYFEVAKPKNATVKAGAKATFKLAISNWGDAESALTKVCATVPGKLAPRPACRTVFVSQGNPGKGTATISVATRRNGKGKGQVNFSIKGNGDSVSTSASLTVKPAKKKPKKSRR